MQQKISLLATDLDGTLLNSDQVVSPATKALIQQAKQRNVRVIIATTRNLYFVQDLCRLLEIDDPVICSNGAHVLSAPFGEEWVYQTIPTDVALTIAQIADEENWNISSTIGSTKYVRRRPGEALGPISPNVTAVESNAAGILGQPMRILLWHPNAIEFFDRFCRTELREYCYTETYYSTDGKARSLGIFPAGADKGSGLALVLQKLNIRSDAVVAIGDNNNDLALFTQAGRKVAMGNGTIALKNQADVIAPDNDHDGVGWAIEQFIL